MAYRVELTRNAEAELEELYLWVTERAPNQGTAWFNGLEQAILALDRFPKRCRIAPESFDPDQPVRVLNYGRSAHVYRVFFTVDESAKLVRVVHIRRGARQRPTPGELKGE
jgi:plasmid stabilization system protein ParE